MRTTEYGVTGLATAPNPQLAQGANAPPGGLKQADNTVIRRAGMIEPRPGFGYGTALTLSAIWKLIPYDGSYLAIGATSGGTRWADNTALSNATWEKHQSRGAEARGNLYLTTSDAVRVVRNAGDTSAPRAGLLPPLVSWPNGASSTGTALLAGQYRAYRAVLKRTDVNTVIVRSEPSARAVFNSIGDIAPTVRVAWTSSHGVIAGDVLELYASLNSTVAQTSDELFLTVEHTITAADLSNGYYDATDALTDVQLVEHLPLYTNGTQEGEARANAMPPLAKDLAVYQGSLFAANIKQPHGYTIRFTEAASATGSATGIGVRAFTATYTNGSNQMTLASVTTGLQVGQLIVPNGGYASWGSSDLYITAISGATLTLNQTYTGGTVAAQATNSIDALWIDTQASGATAKRYPLNTAIDLVSQMTLGVVAVGVGHGSTANTDVRGMNTTDAVYTIGLPTVGAAREVLLERYLPSSGAFYLWATHGDEFQPALPKPAASMPTAQISAQDVFVNGLTYTKQDEPEHWLRRALYLVGRGDTPIVRIVALTDGLYIFKGRGDGIYRLTGIGELNGFRVERLDDTSVLLHPELVTVLENQIYAWTSTGMLRIDGSGAVLVSGPILDQVRVIEQKLNPAAAVHGYAYAAGNATDSEVVFGLPASDTDGLEPTKAYVYNTATKGWTSWFGSGAMTPRTLVYDWGTQRLLAGGASGTPWLENAPDATVVDADNGLTINVVSSDVTTFATVITGGSGWTPAVGDLILSGSTYALVTATSDATHVTLTGAVPTGAAAGWKAIPSTIEWLPKAGKTASVQKRFRELWTDWDDTVGLRAWSWSLAGSRGNTATLAYDRTYSRASARLETVARLPSDVSLGSWLAPTLQISNADARWRVAGLVVDSKQPGGRAAR